MKFIQFYRHSAALQGKYGESQGKHHFSLMLSNLQYFDIKPNAIMCAS